MLHDHKEDILTTIHQISFIEFNFDGAPFATRCTIQVWVFCFGFIFNHKCLGILLFLMETFSWSPPYPILLLITEGLDL